MESKLEVYDNKFDETGVGGKRPNMKHIPFNGDDENPVIVSMIEFKGDLYVATQEGVYILNKDTDELDRIKCKEWDNEV